MNTYEMMMLFDPMAATNWEAVEAEIARLMQRAGGEMILTKKLEERRLAFEILGRKRAMYVLVFFKAPPERITGLERDARLSETILRVLVLKADGMSQTKMDEAALGSGKIEEGGRRDRWDRDDRGPRGDRDRGDRGDRGDRHDRDDDRRPVSSRSDYDS